MDLAGFEPDTLGVGDRDAINGEIVEQVAPDTLNVQTAEPADLLARGEGGDQGPS